MKLCSPIFACCGVEREPNAVDHYSLALQIIQVFPIITDPIVLVLPSAWVARTVAGIALIAGTALVIRTERRRHTRTPRRPSVRKIFCGGCRNRPRRIDT